MAKNQISADVEFQGLISQTPGAGANNSSPFAQFGDLFSDAIVTTPTPTFPTSTTLSSTAPALDAYVLGQRVAYAGGSYTVGASATSYLDLSNTGVLTVSTSATVTANSLRLATVTSSATAITGVVVTAATQPGIPAATESTAPVNLGQVLNVAPQTITLNGGTAASTTYGTTLTFAVPCDGYLVMDSTFSNNTTGTPLSDATLELLFDGTVDLSDSVTANFWAMHGFNPVSAGSHTATAQYTVGSAALADAILIRGICFFIPNP